MLSDSLSPLPRQTRPRSDLFHLSQFIARSLKVTQMFDQVTRDTVFRFRRFVLLLYFTAFVHNAQSSGWAWALGPWLWLPVAVPRSTGTPTSRMSYRRSHSESDVHRCSPYTRELSDRGQRVEICFTTYNMSRDTRLREGDT